MNDGPENRVQELFLAALKLPEAERDAWLVNQCGDAQQRLASVRQLLAHDNIDDDPFEKQLDEALDVPNALVSGATANERSKSDATPMDSKHFISKLSEVGVLSAEEMDALNQSIAAGRSSDDPRQLASQLIKEGKLTDYQASALLKGQPELLIDKYLILDLLDAGGMGMVFKAIHRPMNRKVAIKMIAQHLLASSEQVSRFQREVRVAATLEHPNIVRSYDADQSRGVHFLVMEYVRGETLAKIVHREGPMSVELAIDCIRQAANGLRYAQKQGVIHRDIKPDNLMLSDEGLVKVLDLGLASVDESFRLAQRSSFTDDEESPTARSLAGTELTAAGTVLGTVSFMAPEQSLDARKADTRADIYSLGCTLYYLLIGEAPYKGDTIFQVFTQHREGAIPALRDKRPDVPEIVETVCQKMLAKAPEDRFQSMGELLAAIEDCDIAPPDKGPEKGVTRGDKEKPPTDGFAPTVTMPATQATASEQTAPRGVLGWVTALVMLLAVLGGGSWWWKNNANHNGQQSPVTDTTTNNGDGDISPVTQPATTPLHALMFDGVDDYMTVPTLRLDDSQPITIEAWITPHDISGDQDIWGIAGLRLMTMGAPIELANWFFRADNNEGSFSTHPFRNIDPVEQPSTGRVFHVATVWTPGQMTLCVNGLLIQRMRKVDETSNTIPMVERGPLTIATQHQGLMLGSRDKDGDHAYHGIIHAFRISNITRYTKEFTPPQRFEADENTLALYHFDEGEGTVLKDSSGNGHHGKIVGAKWVRMDDDVQPVREVAQQEHAIEFGGWGDEIRIPTLTYDGSHPITLEAWAMLKQVPDNEVIHLLGNFMGSHKEGTQAGLELEIRSRPSDVDGPVWAAWVATSDGAGNHLILRGEPASLRLRRRSHLAVTLDRDATQFFVDGKLVENRSLDQKHRASNTSFLFGGGFIGALFQARISNTVRYTEDFIPEKRFENDEHTLALYHFDEGLGDVSKDSSGNGHHGKIAGAKWVRVDDELKVIEEEQAAKTPTTYTWPEDQPTPAIAPFTAEEARVHQEAWAKHLGVEVEMENSIGMKFRVIPPGEFLMGSSEEEIRKLTAEMKQLNWYLERISTEGPQHRVTLTRPFGLAIHEVTRSQFRQFVEATGYKTEAETDGEGGLGWGKTKLSPEVLWNTNTVFEVEQTDEHPVVNVSWNDAVAFCKWLSEKEDVTYRLPTEAEWEFACRAGNQARFCFGDDLAGLHSYSWCDRQGGKNTMPVGQKLPNALGVFDLHGNVEEWCEDRLGNYTANPTVDPVSRSIGFHYVSRGGNFNSPPLNVRSSFRNANSNPDGAPRHFVIGFRVARSFEQYELKQKPEPAPETSPGKNN